MKITKVTPLLIDRYLFVEVETDEGIKGLGESGAWGFLEASAACIESFSRILIGADPLRIEHLNNYMYRCYHFRGAAIMGAVSAIDIALWDIAGKHFGAPVYQLLGGKCRDKARVYYHVFGDTTEKLVQACIDAKQQGFTAVGHLTPFLDESRSKPYYETHVQRMERAIDRVRQYREAVGDEVDLCVEIHRQLTPHEAIVLARGIEKYHPYFYEDPVRPDNISDMIQIAEHIHIPIATGERLHTLQEFEMLLSKRAVNYVRPDVCICGGITGAKKIAALAEACGVGVVPHNPLSPVSTAACLQIAACIPNFALQEYPLGEGMPPKSDIVGPKVERDGGYLVISDRPGIGVELLEGAAERHPFRPRDMITRLHEDGSVFDQ